MSKVSQSEEILRENFNLSMKRLRGQLFNLVDSIQSDVASREATKELIKDFTQQFWNEYNKIIVFEFDKK